MRVHTPLDLGLLIRETRRQKSLHQNDLAQMVGVSRQWIVEVEHGKPRAELGLVLRTLAVLGVNLDAETGVSVPNVATPLALVDLDDLLDGARGPRK